jgi:hypothetical protein
MAVIMRVEVFEKSIYGYPIVTVRDDNGYHIKTVKKEYWDIGEKCNFKDADGLADPSQVVVFLENLRNTYESSCIHCRWIKAYFPTVESWIENGLKQREDLKSKEKHVEL